MKGRISDIKRFAVHDGDGIRTTLFLKGCPLACVWCHNPEGISFAPQLAHYENKCISCGACVKTCTAQAHKMTAQGHVYDRKACISCGACAEDCIGDALSFFGREVTADQILPKLLEDRDFYETSGGGVTLSGGECLMQADFCVELLQKLKIEHIHTAVDTCGYVKREVLDRVIPYTDMFLYDIKAIDEETHIRCTGKSNRLILENLQYLNEQNCKIEVRIPFVPGYNDGEPEKIAAFLENLQNVKKVRVLPYHNFAGSKYQALFMKNTLPDIVPTEEQIRHAEAYFKK